MNILKSTEMMHPLLIDSLSKIQKIIDSHNIPMKLFETGRTHDRHASMIRKGKAKDIISRQLFNLENDPPLYATGFEYVYYDNRWSWNLRDSTIKAWYELFGNLVLDACPELEWGGFNRKSTNYCYFQLRYAILVENLDETPCVTP